MTADSRPAQGSLPTTGLRADPAGAQDRGERQAAEFCQPELLQLTDHFPVGSYVFYRDPIDDSPRFSFFSNRLLEMLDLSRAEFEADPMTAYRPMHPDDLEPFWALANQAARERTAFNVDVRYIIRGSLRWYRLESTPRSLPGGLTCWDGAVIDITDRRRAEEALAEAREKEKQVEENRRRELEQKLKTSLTAAAIAHKIRQPLSQIQLNCQLAVAALATIPEDTLPPALRESLMHIIADGHRLQDTIERMRMLLRNVETSHTPCDLSESVDSALVFLGSALRASDVRWCVNGLEQTCLLSGDAAQLQIAVVNIIRNAIEALDAVPPEQRQLRIQLLESQAWFELRVEDSGPGFPAAMQHDITSVLLRSTKSGGMGIGLFVAFTATTNHNGTMQIGRSTSLGGGEVVIQLPRLPRAAAGPATGADG